FAKLFNLDPLLGVVLGAVSMEGGHGNATAYGGTIEELGVNSAFSIGIAAATFGLIAGGLIGGPIVRYLISKYHLKPTETEEVNIKDPKKEKDIPRKQLDSQTFMTQVFVITLCMALGTYLGDLFSD